MAFICIGCWELPEDGPQAPGGQHLLGDKGNEQGGEGVGDNTRHSRIEAKRHWHGPGTLGILTLPLTLGLELGDEQGLLLLVGVRGRIQVPLVPPDKPVWCPRLGPGEEPSQVTAWLAYLSKYLSAYQG